MTEPSTLLRVGIPSSIDDAHFRHFPAGVTPIRYDLDAQKPIEVDIFVPPGFSKTLASLMPRVHARYIQTMSAGVEAILPFVPQDALLCNARGVHESSTAEWAVTAILASLKWLPLYGELQHQGVWGTNEQTGRYWEEIYGTPHEKSISIMVEELSGKSVLIVGYGSIGKAIEARLRPFKPASITRLARTARADEHGPVHGMAELNDLLPEADIVVLITPLTEETHHLIGHEQLGRMRRGALLVNAARGAVADTDALVEALRSRHIRAALDVTDPEPLPEGHPLWTAPGLLLTPHIAGSTPAFLERVFRFLGRQAERVLAGEQPENIIRGGY